MAAHQQSRMGAPYASHGYDDTAYYTPPPPPELISPEPQRHMPEMSSQIQHGLQNMSLDHRESVASHTTNHDHSQRDSTRALFSGAGPTQLEVPHFSPFPKLKNPGANIPPSDEEFEETLWNARNLVLDSTDPEMQLAWAGDALIYVGISAENEERIAAAKPSAARSSTPNIEHTLKTDAMSIVTFLASQHHPKAEFLRGMWLEWGRYGEREDKKEAFKCYSRAADKGYARAEYRIGMMYESLNDAPKALRHYHRGVEAGDSASCYRLGMMTLRGQHGQQQDWKRAVDLIRLSAETADENAAQGAYVYGMLLARQLPQINVPEQFLRLDEANARIFIEKAAFLRFAKAQLKMGSSYELGAMGCEFDPALSIHYYALASRQGEPEADMALSKWFLVGHEGLFSKNEDLSFTYAERAAATGLATAEFAMGYFYEIGMGVAVDTRKSLEWYQKAAEHGNEDARGRIEALANKQYLSKKDHEQVAIHRIKSMHNSMHTGGRPERRAVATLSLGGIQEGNYRHQQQSGPPPRGASVVPYPLNDRPMSNNGPRSASVMPYPDNPADYPHSPGLQNWSQPPRPATTTYYDQRPNPQQQQPPRQGYAQSPQMGYDTRFQQPPMPGRSPRPDMYPPQGRPAQNQRIVSSPAHMQQGQGYPAQPSPRLQQYPPSAPGTPYQGSRPPPQQQQMQGPMVGYSAPRPGPQQGRPPAQQQAFRPGQSGQMQQSQSAPNLGPNMGGGPRPPAKDPIPQPPPQPKPPRGPTTFEQMGVQSKKNGDDCVMM